MSDFVTSGINSAINTGREVATGLANDYLGLNLGTGGATDTTWAIIAADGSRAIDFFSFVNIDVTSENPVTQAPIEQGGFVDYNRVITPLQIGLMLSVKGTNSHLQTVIDQIDELCNTCELVNIVTPYQEFKNFAIQKYQYSQENTKGLDVLYFDFSLVEIRQVATQYSNARISKRQPRGQQQPKEQSIISSIFTGS